MANIVLYRPGRFFEDVEAGRHIDRFVRSTEEQLQGLGAPDLSGVEAAIAAETAARKSAIAAEAAERGAADKVLAVETIGRFFYAFDDPITSWTADDNAGTITYPNDGLSGGRVLQTVGRSGYTYPNNIPFDPDAVYRIRARVRRVVSGGGGASGQGANAQADTVVILTSGTSWTVPSGVTTVRVDCGGGGGGGGGDTDHSAGHAGGDTTFDGLAAGGGGRGVGGADNNLLHGEYTGSGGAGGASTMPTNTPGSAGETGAGHNPARGGAGGASGAAAITGLSAYGGGGGGSYVATTIGGGGGGGGAYGRKDNHAVTPGASISYTVGAGGAGGGSGTSGTGGAIRLTYSTPGGGNTAPAKPAAPTGSAPSSSAIDWSWVAPNNGGAAITDYDLEVRQGSTGNGTDQGVGNVLTFADTGLSANTGYQARVRATNSVGSSSWSDWSSTVTTQQAPQTPVAPSVPRNLAESSRTDKSITWGWDAPSTGSAPISYEYRHALSSGSFSGSWNDNGTSRTVSITGLNPSTAYKIQVRAKNTHGTSSAVEDTASTLAKTHRVYIGLRAYGYNGTTELRPTTVATGDDHDAHWFCADGGTLAANNEWKVFTGYVKGDNWVAGSVAPTVQDEADSPAPMVAGTKYIRPCFLVDGGTWQIDFISVDIVVDGVVPTDATAPTIAINAVSTVAEGNTTSLTAEVSGGNYDEYSVAWSRVSGVGTVSGSTLTGSYTAPQVNSDTATTVRVSLTVRGNGVNARNNTSATVSDDEAFTVVNQAALTPPVPSAPTTGVGPFGRYWRWDTVSGATAYDLEYAFFIPGFDWSGITVVSNATPVHGFGKNPVPLISGSWYQRARVRSKNANGTSLWGPFGYYTT